VRQELFPGGSIGPVFTGSKINIAAISKRRRVDGFGNFSITGPGVESDIAEIMTEARPKKGL
jgi:hypothetical protein